MSRTAPLSLVLYGMATALLEPLAPLILGLRVRRGREDEMRLGERLGLASVARPAGRVVWLHGVSVGETASLLPLIDTLRQRRPDLGLLRAVTRAEAFIPCRRVGSFAAARTA